MNGVTPATAIATSVLLFSSGCGTLANLNAQKYPLMGGTEPTRPFGGVRRDVGWVTSVTAPYNLLFAADLPVSLIGDVATLPITYPKPLPAGGTEKSDR